MLDNGRNMRGDSEEKILEFQLIKRKGVEKNLGSFIQYQVSSINLLTQGNIPKTN